MVKVIFFHKVKDVTTWKRVFDSAYNLRKKFGEITSTVGTVHGDPTNVCVINEWDTIEKFNKFKNSTELETAMKEAGVIEKPTITIIDEVHTEVYHEHSKN